MRKALAVGVPCLAASLLLSAKASASLLIYEPFDYTAGSSITGQTNPSTGGTWNLAGSAAALHVVGNSSLSPSPVAPAVGNDADLKKSGTSSAYDRLNIPNAFNPDLSPKYGANSTLYYSLLLNVPSLDGLTIDTTNVNANNDGLIAFNNVQGATGSAPNTWNGELVIRKDTATSSYQLGIRGSTTPAGTTYFTGDLTPGQTYFIVVQATLGASPGTAAQDLNSIWVNPSSATFGLDELSRPSPDGSSTGANSTNASLDSMQSLIIGAGIATSGAAPNDTNMDEIRVGETWADVTTVPEPSSVALLGLGLTSLAATRRRRRTA